MAESMEEFDSPPPVSKVFCSRLSMEEYEDQSVRSTEEGLESLIQYLKTNPALYRRIMSRRKIQEEQNAGLLSYIKVFGLFQSDHH